MPDGMLQVWVNSVDAWIDGQTLVPILMLAHPGSVPTPVHEGGAAIWHLADVLTWLQAKGSYSLGKGVLDVARTALQVNLAKEAQRLSRSVCHALEALV